MKDTLHAAGSIAEARAIVPLDACPICACTEQTDFFEVRGLPVHVCVYGQSREEARRAAKGDVILAYCHGCGFVHNRIFDPAKLSYRPGYEASLVYSKVFSSFLEGVAKRLTERFALQGKTLIEIGCGGGEFLRMLCKLGDNDGIGIDPSLQSEGVQRIGRRRIRFIRDYFSQEHTNLVGDFVCCLSVLEHIPDPAATIRNVRKLIGDRDAGVYFEVFNAFNAFRNRETWSILYEQCNYFGLESFRGLFERCGFQVTEAAECYEGGQYVHVEAVPSQLSHQVPPRNTRGELPAELAEFARSYQRNLAIWRERIEQFKQTGKRVVIWGTGGKGIGFLNALDTADVIRHALEINPRKHGKFVPGTGQQIVPPEFLAEYRPDVVIITNALYEREMKQQAADLGVNCEFLIA